MKKQTTDGLHNAFHEQEEHYEDQKKKRARSKKEEKNVTRFIRTKTAFFTTFTYISIVCWVFVGYVMYNYVTLEDAENDPVTPVISEVIQVEVIESESVTEAKNEPSSEQIIRETARKAGFEDEDLLIRIAMCESGDKKAGYINPLAKNPNSSARGAFQYLEGTWQEGVKKTGNDWTLDDRYDVEKSARMAIWHISKGYLSKWNSSINCWS